MMSWSILFGEYAVTSTKHPVLDKALLDGWISGEEWAAVHRLYTQFFASVLVGNRISISNYIDILASGGSA